MNWRPPARDDRQITALWGICAVAFVVLRPLWVASAAILPRCLWHARTGIPCPGCGTTRAVLALLHGHPLAAFVNNPLAAVGAIVFVGGGLTAPIWLAAGGVIPVVASRPRPIWLTAGVLTVAANWAWLYASGV